VPLTHLSSLRRLVLDEDRLAAQRAIAPVVPGALAVPCPPDEAPQPVQQQEARCDHRPDQQRLPDPLRCRLKSLQRGTLGCACQVLHLRAMRPCHRTSPLLSCATNHCICWSNCTCDALLIRPQLGYQELAVIMNVPTDAESRQSNLHFVTAISRLFTTSHLFGAASEAALHGFRAVLSRVLQLPRSVLNLSQPRVQSMLQRRLGVRQLQQQTRTL